VPSYFDMGHAVKSECNFSPITPSDGSLIMLACSMRTCLIKPRIWILIEINRENNNPKPRFLFKGLVVKSRDLKLIYAAKAASMSKLVKQPILSGRGYQCLSKMVNFQVLVL
jgi:hypothetical protein